jgi:flagellar basal body-associated protein FliL
MVGMPAERKTMNNGLVDEEKSFIVPLMVVGVVVVVVLLIAGLFMPPSVKAW